MKDKYVEIKAVETENNKMEMTMIKCIIEKYRKEEHDVEVVFLKNKFAVGVYQVFTCSFIQPGGIGLPDGIARMNDNFLKAMSERESVSMVIGRSGMSLSDIENDIKGMLDVPQEIKDDSNVVNKFSVWLRDLSLDEIGKHRANEFTYALWDIKADGETRSLVSIYTSPFSEDLKNLIVNEHGLPPVYNLRMIYTLNDSGRKDIKHEASSSSSTPDKNQGGEQDENYLIMQTRFMLSLINSGKKENDIEKVRSGVGLAKLITDSLLRMKNVNDKLLTDIINSLCNDCFLLEHCLDGLYAMAIDIPYASNDLRCQIIKGLLTGAEDNHQKLKMVNPDAIPLVRDTNWYLEIHDICLRASLDTGCPPSRLLVPELQNNALAKAYTAASTLPELMDMGDWLRQRNLNGLALKCYRQAEVEFRESITASEKERLIQVCKDGIGFPDDMKINLNAGGN